MDKISFNNVLPQVFSNAGNLSSDIWNCNATFEKDKLYLIEAESGKGKSTFCSYIMGYRHDFSGELTFDSTSTKSMKTSDWVEMRKTHLAYLFQELRLFPELTAMENVEIKNKLTGHQSEKQIDEWFDMLGIADKKGSKIGRMSFGQQQRVAMIRSLCQPFDFILADEPISHLDERNADIMAEIMVTEAKRQGAGIIVTSIGKHMNIMYDRIYKL